MSNRLKNFITESIRVLKVTKKPTNAEFKAVVKVSALGILIIGVIGFIIHITWQLLR